MTSPSANENTTPRDIETFTLTWQGIEIEISYEADWLGSKVRGADSFATSHLQLCTQEPERPPLPVTTTGYRSHFVPFGLVEEAGGPIAFVQAWLDEEARSESWKRHLEASRQLSLFDAL